MVTVLSLVLWYRFKLTIEQFFDAPTVNRKWKVDRTDPMLVRFGLLWKVYDMVALKGVDFRLPILPSTSGTLHGYQYLLGGSSGMSFLVEKRPV